MRVFDLDLGEGAATLTDFAHMWPGLRRAASDGKATTATVVQRFSTNLIGGPTFAPPVFRPVRASPAKEET